MLVYTVILDRRYLGSLFGLERAVLSFRFFCIFPQIFSAKMNPKVVTFQTEIRSIFSSYVENETTVMCLAVLNTIFLCHVSYVMRCWKQKVFKNFLVFVLLHDSVKWNCDVLLQENVFLLQSDKSKVSQWQ